jgi:hypothetical protein
LPFYEKKSHEDLKRLDRDNTDLDIHNLENYLNEEEFEEAFGISSFAFRLLKPQDKKALVSLQLFLGMVLLYFINLACLFTLKNAQKARAGLLPEKVVVKRVEDDQNSSKVKQIYRATLVRKMGTTSAVRK